MKQYKGMLLAFVFLFSAHAANAACVLPDDADFISINGGCEDQVSGLVWSVSKGISKQASAVTNCGNRDEGGFTDWRLPTIEELLSLTQHQAALGVNYIEAFDPGRSLWSATRTQNKKSGYVAVGLFATSATLYSVNSLIDYVCVR